MKPGIAWNVKGVEQDIRDAARDAARRSGMSLGEWLNTVILDQPGEAAEPPRMPRMQPAGSRNDRIHDRLESLAAQLSALSREDQATTAGPHYRDPRPQAEQAEALEEVLQRVAHNERQTQSDLQLVTGRLDGLARKMDQIAALGRVPARAEDVPGFRALDAALRKVVDHVEKNELRTIASLKTMQERLASVAANAEEQPDALERVMPTVQRIEGRISDPTRRVETAEQNSQMHDIISLVEEHFAKLAQRIEQIQETAELATEIPGLRTDIASIRGTLASVRNDVAPLPEIHAAVAAIRPLSERVGQVERLAALSDVTHRDVTALKTAVLHLSERIESVKGQSMDGPRLRSEFGALSQRVEAFRREMATDADVASLRSALEQLSRRVALGTAAGTAMTGLSPAAVADLEQRIGQIAQRIDTFGAPQDGAQFAELEYRLGQLTQRVDSAPSLAPYMAEIDSRLGQLADRMDEFTGASSAPMIEDLEHRLNALSGALTTIAQQPDQGMLQEIRQQVAETEARIGAVESRLGSLDTIERAIGTLQDGLAGLRESAAVVAEDAATRAVHQGLAETGHGSPSGAPSQELTALRDALQTVQESARTSDAQTQETLRAVHDTLAQIVGKLADLEAAGPEAAGVRTAAGADPYAAAPAAVYTPNSPPEAAAYPPYQASAPADQQMDAGYASTAPGFSTDHSFRFDTQAAAEAPGLAPLMTERRPAAEDYIAAARRAAAASIVGEAGQGTANAHRAELSSAGTLSRFKTHRRKLVIAGLIVLMAVSAFAVTKNQFASPPETVPVPAAETADSAAAPADESMPDGQPAQPGDQTSAAPAPAAAIPAITQASPGAAAPGDSGMAEMKTGETDAAAATAEPASAPQIADDIPDGITPDSLRQAALSGDATAQFVIASRLLAGDGIAADPARSIVWFERAAASLVPAQYRLGTLYESGTGVARDPVKAKEWYERAAKGGNIKAMHNLAVINANPGPGTPNYAEALKWFSAAAKFGVRDSIFNIAVLNERGLGMTRNLPEAYFWYALASDRGDTEAKQKLALLKGTLTSADLAKVKQRLASWTAAVPDSAANQVEALAQWQPPASPAAPASAGNSVTLVQGYLNKLGLFTGTADGRMSNRLADAVRVFQMQNGLPVNGRITPDLVEKLKTAAAT